MITGHGDDIHQYKDIRINFSSNVYNHFDHSGLFHHLSDCLPTVCNYPEPTPERLEHELATVLGIRPQEVMVTSGATEGIYLIAQAFRGVCSTIMHPTFAEYEDACRLNHHVLGSDREDMIWLCNPNNPTGLVIDKEGLRQIITDSPEVIYIIDASYAPFTLEPLLTAAEAIPYPNVLMIHSMTKEYAIPGLRLGYLTGSEQLISKVRTLRLPWSVNALAQKAGLYLLAHRDQYTLDLPALMAERQRVSEALNQIPGLEVFPSDTHILLCRCTSDKLHTLAHTAAILKRRLAEDYGILIRDASNFEGLDASFFRIAIQTPPENDALIQALREILKPLNSKL